jgi:hypothetical protein
VTTITLSSNASRGPEINASGISNNHFSNPVSSRNSTTTIRSLLNTLSVCSYHFPLRRPDFLAEYCSTHETIINRKRLWVGGNQERDKNTGAVEEGVQRISMDSSSSVLRSAEHLRGIVVNVKPG